MIWEKLLDIFDPVAKIVDETVTSKEEKQTLFNELEKIKNQASENILKYQTELLKAQAKIVEAEAGGESFLQRNWRPILMLVVVAIVANNYLLFPYLSMFTEKAVMLDLPDGLYNLMTIGVGGYVVGRSAEKTVKNLKK